MPAARSRPQPPRHHRPGDPLENDHEGPVERHEPGVPPAGGSHPMRVAINLLTDHPDNPTEDLWGWSRTIPEMAKLLTPDEEFLLVVSPRWLPLHQGYGDNVVHSCLPWLSACP